MNVGQREAACIEIFLELRTPAPPTMNIQQRLRTYVPNDHDWVVIMISHFKTFNNTFP